MTEINLRAHKPTLKCELYKLYCWIGGSRYDTMNNGKTTECLMDNRYIHTGKFGFEYQLV